MKVTVICVCIVIDDDRNGPMPMPLRRNPLDDLVERMHREMQRGRDSAGERTVHGAKVAG